MITCVSSKSDIVEISDIIQGKEVWSTLDLPILRLQYLKNLGDVAVCLFEDREIVITIDRLRIKT